MLEKSKSCSIATPVIGLTGLEQMHASNWQITNKLGKSFPLVNSDLWQFAEEILTAANKINHHPTLILTEGKCTIELVTHANDSITTVDASLANEIDKIYAKYDRKPVQLLIFNSNLVTHNTAVNSSAKFDFKNFTQAFDFGQKALACIPASVFKTCEIRIGWGECVIIAPQQYLAKITDVYNTLTSERRAFKLRSSL